MFAWIFSLLALINSFLPQPTYREGIVGQPLNLNPLEISTNQPDRDLARFIHRGLMKYDDKGNLVPDLAERFKVSDDRKEYTFYLHKNLYWHDGQKFNADDVIETVAKQNLEVLQADKLDEFTIRFTLIKDPYTPMLDLLTVYILPASFKHRSQSGLNVVGLGDYRVSRIKKSAKIESVYLTRARPWEKNPNSFSRIIFSFYDTPQDLLTAARLGEIDASGLTENVPLLPDFNRFSFPVGSRYYALFFNLVKEPYADRDVRKFLESLIDPVDLVDRVLSGSAVPAYSPLEFTSVLSSLATPSARPRVSLKRKIEKPLVLTVPELPGDTSDQPLLRVGERIKSDWEKAGLTVEIRKIPINSIFSEVVTNKDFEILLFGQEVERDPDVYTLWHSAQINLPGLNFTSYKSPLSDRALEEGRKTFNSEERLLSYQHFVKIFNEDVPAIFLYHPLYTFSFRKNLRGPNGEGFFKISDRFVNFKDWRQN